MQLYEKYNGYSEDKELEGFYECPQIEQNLSPKMSLRPYQREAYARFQKFLSVKEKKQDLSPTHLLFNMATGSGKTLVMAMFILELYQRGYRNFLFFVKALDHHLFKF